MNNIDTGLEIAKKLNIKVPRYFAQRAIHNKELAKSLISKWKRRPPKTFCGQFTSEFFIKGEYLMISILRGKEIGDINTSGQYRNALKSVEAGDLDEVTAEQAYYLAAIGRPALALSPSSMKVNGKPYNHAALIWPIFRTPYNPQKGPKIIQQGWYSLINEHISHKYAWGKNWTNPMVKYFLPDLK